MGEVFGKHTLKSCRIYLEDSRASPLISWQGTLALGTSWNWHGSDYGTRPAYREPCVTRYAKSKAWEVYFWWKWYVQDQAQLCPESMSKWHKQVTQTVALIPLDAQGHGVGILYDHLMEKEKTQVWFIDRSMWHVIISWLCCVTAPIWRAGGDSTERTFSWRTELQGKVTRRKHIQRHSGKWLGWLVKVLEGRKLEDLG